MKYLSWLVALVILVLLIVLLFRKSLVAVLTRGGVKIGKEGIRIDAAAAAAAVSVQSEATPVDKGLSIAALAPSAAVTQDQAEIAQRTAEEKQKQTPDVASDTEANKRLAAGRRIGVSLVVQEQEDRIRADLATLNLTNNPTEAIDLLVRSLGVAQPYHAAERIYRMIFGDQIAILKEMNLTGSMHRDQLRRYYEYASRNFQTFYSRYTYTFDSYIAFFNYQSTCHY